MLCYAVQVLGLLQESLKTKPITYHSVHFNQSKQRRNVRLNESSHNNRNCQITADKTFSLPFLGKQKKEDNDEGFHL